jgi:hypothetical protein
MSTFLDVHVELLALPVPDDGAGLEAEGFLNKFANYRLYRKMEFVFFYFPFFTDQGLATAGDEVTFVLCDRCCWSW